jgi:hypothetical protein
MTAEWTKGGIRNGTAFPMGSSTNTAAGGNMYHEAYDKMGRHKQ